MAPRWEVRRRGLMCLVALLTLMLGLPACEDTTPPPDPAQPMLPQPSPVPVAQTGVDLAGAFPVAAVPANAPVAVVTDPADLDPDTQHLTIVPRGHAAVVQPLAALRRSRGLHAAILELDTGSSSRWHKAATLNEALQNLPKLDYLLLAAAADPDASLFLPAFTTRAALVTDQYPNDPLLVSDHGYSVRTDKLDPRVMVGRFPATDAEALAVMVGKTLAYEASPHVGPWRRRIELFAGQGHYSPAIDAALENMFRYIMTAEVPAAWDVALAYANPRSVYSYAPSGFSNHLIDRLNTGPALAVYIGHGSHKGFDRFTWRGRSYPILDEAAVDRITIPTHRTMVVSIACSTGGYDLTEPSIGQRLLASPTGPVVFVGSSRISQPYANGLFAGYLVDSMLKQPPATVGEALRQVRRSFHTERLTTFRFAVDMAASTVLPGEHLPAQRRDQLHLYNLFGDPAASLGLVRQTATLVGPTTASPGEELAFTLEAQATLDGRAHVAVQLSRDAFKQAVEPVLETAADAEPRMAAMNRLANDKTLLAAVVPVRDGRATWTFTLPADTPPGRLFVTAYLEPQAPGTPGTPGTADAAAAVELQVLPSP